jgi:sulfide:quinone oxidoreductase
MQSAMTGREIHDIAIVGGGAGGLATASSLLARRRDLDIVMVEPQTKHYYQTGWTMVGAGVFRAADTERDKADSYLAARAGSKVPPLGFRPRQMKS